MDDCVYSSFCQVSSGALRREWHGGSGAQSIQVVASDDDQTVDLIHEHLTREGHKPRESINNGLSCNRKYIGIQRI